MSTSMGNQQPARVVRAPALLAPTRLARAETADETERPPRHAAAASARSPPASSASLKSPRSNGSSAPPAAPAAMSRTEETASNVKIPSGAMPTKKRSLPASKGENRDPNSLKRKRLARDDEDDDAADEEEEEEEEQDHREAFATERSRHKNARDHALAHHQRATAASSRPFAKKQHQHHQHELTLATRMAQHLFHHSSALLHRGNMETEARGGVLDDEIRQQQEKRDKYDRKIRSLQRELAELDPRAAAAHARGESIALIRPSSSMPRPPQQAPSSSAADDGDELDALLPAPITQQVKTIRRSLQERSARLKSFVVELNGEDAAVQSEEERRPW